MVRAGGAAVLSRAAGALAAEVLRMIGAHVKPGVSIDALDRICHDYIVDVQQHLVAGTWMRAYAVVD